jgi:hypothetical protein
MGLRKAETLAAQRRLFPEAASVFDGDTGQGDWIAALILRDMDPEGFPYAAMHDVRPWSRPHRDLLRAALLESKRLEALYRRHLGLPAGPLGLDDEDRLDRALARARANIDRALGGPRGRLDSAFLRERGIFLFRNHVELALDLAEAGHLSRAAAERVVAAAVRDVRFLRENAFGFDSGGAARLADRLQAWIGAAVAR